MEKALGEIFRNYRKRKKITQKDLAILLDCSLPTVGKIEIGKYSAGQKILRSFLAQSDITKDEREFVKKYRSEKKEKKINTENTNYTDIIKDKALSSDYATTNRLVKIMWDFREALFKYFQEIDLLLATNEYSTNKKMERGILKTSKDLEEMSEKMKKYLVKEIKEAQII